MYNGKQLSAFIKKVNKEAEAAAQSVFDSYEAEFTERVKKQLRSGDKIVASMGTAYFSNKDLDCEFLTIFSEIQWLEQRASFNTHEIEKL